MNSRRRRIASAAAAFTATAVAACGGSPGPPPAAPPFADPGFVESGEYRLHYALTLTRDLPPAVAGSYGVMHRRNLALLTVALVPCDAAVSVGFADARVEATAIALTGTRTALAVTRHDEAGAPTWLATVDVRHRVPVTIEIRARATAASPEIRIRLTREFRLD